MTRTEYRLLGALAARIGTTATRRELIELLWPTIEDVSPNTVDSHVRRLRAKLAATRSPLRIETMHGTGFRLLLLPEHL